MPNEFKKHKSVAITIRSEPFRDDPVAAESYYAALGRILILFGRFENHLAHTLLAINNLPEAAALQKRSIPIPFNQKAKLWREFFCGVPILEKHRENDLSLISDAGDANQDRAVIAHGHFNEFIAEDPLTARFLVHRDKGDRIIFERYDVTIEVLERVIKTIDALNTRLLPITWSVVTIHPHRIPASPAKPSERQ